MNKDILLEKLQEITEKLISESKQNKKQVYWLTLDGNKGLSFSESIYNGNAGIILFLIEYNRMFPDKRVEELIAKSVENLYWFCKDKPSSNFSLITGRMGVVYLLLYYSKTTANREYTNKALELAKACKLNGIDHIINDKAELLNGLSGALLGFITLYSYAKEKWVLQQIKFYLAAVIRKTEVSESGVYWDKSTQQIKPLCGFSHGVSGIAYVLDILAFVSKNPFLHWLANQGYHYEDLFYNLQTNNWPDFRKGAYSLEELSDHIEKYKIGDISFFTKPGEMKAWCHGSPGSNIARLQSDRLHKTSNYKARIDSLTEELLKEDLPSNNYPISLTLCHGLLGNYTFLQELNKGTNNVLIKSKLNQVVSFSFAQKEKFGYFISGYPSQISEDQSLFMGNAGIGLFYMNQMDENSLSALNPASFIASINDLEIDLGEFNYEYFLKIYLAKTFGHLGSQFRHIVSEFSQGLSTKMPNTLSNSILIDTLISEMGSLKSDQRLPLTIEKEKQKLRLNIESVSLLNIRKIVNRELILTTNNSDLLRCKFKVPNTTKLLEVEGMNFANMTPIMYYDADHLDINLIRLNEIEFEIFKNIQNGQPLVHDDVSVVVLKKFLYLNIIYFENPDINL